MKTVSIYPELCAPLWTRAKLGSNQTVVEKVSQLSLMPSAMSRTISGANGEEPSESELPVKYSALIRLFVCPVCHEYMKPPIPQCKKGHVLCVDCRPKVKGVCPLCKQKVGNQTNIMMEQMCDLIRFPCGYSVKVS